MLNAPVRDRQHEAAKGRARLTLPIDNMIEARHLPGSQRDHRYVGNQSYEGIRVLCLI